MTLGTLLSYSAGPIGAAFISFITLPFLAHFFSAEDVGRYSLLMVVLSLSTMVFSLGLNQSYVREYHEYEFKPSLILISTLPCVLAMFLLILLYVLMPFSLSHFLFDVDSKLFSILVILSIFISVLCNQYSHVLRMEERPLLFSFSAVLPRAIFLLLLGLLVFLSDSKDFDVVIYANLGSLFLQLTFFLVTVPIIFLSFKANIDFEKLKQMIRFGLPLIFGGVAFWGIASVDRFLLKHYASLTELGIYSMAVSFASIGSIFTSIFGTIWHPLVYKWNQNGIEPDKLQRVLDLAAVAIAVIWSLTGLFGWFVAFLLPSDYADVVFILPLCIAVPLLYLLSEITQIGIGISRKTFYSMLISVFALVVNVIINLLLLEQYGAYGASVASAFAFMFFLLGRTEISFRLLPVFKRSRMYSVVIVFLFTSIFFAFYGKFVTYSCAIWIFPLAFVLCVYRHELLVSYRNLQGSF